MLKNITEFKELDSAKTTFISTISHELKTPISAIMMKSAIIRRPAYRSLNEEQEDLANSIKENSERLLNINRRIAEYDAGRIRKLQLKPKDNQTYRVDRICNKGKPCASREVQHSNRSGVP